MHGAVQGSTLQFEISGPHRNGRQHHDDENQQAQAHKAASPEYRPVKSNMRPATACDFARLAEDST